MLMQLQVLLPIYAYTFESTEHSTKDIELQGTILSFYCDFHLFVFMAGVVLCYLVTKAHIFIT